MKKIIIAGLIILIAAAGLGIKRYYNYRKYISPAVTVDWTGTISDDPQPEILINPEPYPTENLPHLAQTNYNTGTLWEDYSQIKKKVWKRIEWKDSNRGTTKDRDCDYKATGSNKEPDAVWKIYTDADSNSSYYSYHYNKYGTGEEYKGLYASYAASLCILYYPGSIHHSAYQQVITFHDKNQINASKGIVMVDMNVHKTDGFFGSGFGKQPFLPEWTNGRGLHQLSYGGDFDMQDWVHLYEDMWQYLYNHPSKLRLYEIKNSEFSQTAMDFNSIGEGYGCDIDYSEYYVVYYGDMRKNIKKRIENGETKLNEFKKVWDVIFPEGRDTI